MAKSLSKACIQGSLNLLPLFSGRDNTQAFKVGQAVFRPAAALRQKTPHCKMLSSLILVSLRSCFTLIATPGA